MGLQSLPGESELEQLREAKRIEVSNPLSY